MSKLWKREPNDPPWKPEYKSWDEGYKAHGLHACLIDTPCHSYGRAIDECTEDLDGYLFVYNGEYGSQVNYCPMCGYKAKKSVDNQVT